MTRLIHFSDIHLFEPNIPWRTRDLFSKRLTGWINNRYMHRGKTFRQANHVLKQLVEDAYFKNPDMVLFSGDATTLGTSEEFRLAATLLKVNEPGTPSALAVPGNHDYYSPRCAQSGLFEKTFATWQEGIHVDDHTYPFAKVVKDAFIVGLNTCQGNRWAWDSTGKVTEDELHRLEKLLQHPDAENKTKMLVTHYPVFLKDGQPEKRHRRLRNLKDVLIVARKHGVSLWLHGHRHDPYIHPATADTPATICVGSGTQLHRWNFHEYLLEGKTLTIQMHMYDASKGKFEVGRRETITL